MSGRCSRGPGLASCGGLRLRYRRPHCCGRRFCGRRGRRILEPHGHLGRATTGGLRRPHHSGLLLHVLGLAAWRSTWHQTQSRHSTWDAAFPERPRGVLPCCLCVGVHSVRRPTLRVAATEVARPTTCEGRSGHFVAGKQPSAHALAKDPATTPEMGSRSVQDARV